MTDLEKSTQVSLPMMATDFTVFSVSLRNGDI